MQEEDLKNEYIYCCYNPIFKHEIVKIGWTRDHPHVRLKSLSSTLPEDFILHFAIVIPSGIHSNCRGKDIEKAIHDLLCDYRYKANREYFKIPIEDLKQRLQKMIHAQDRPFQPTVMMKTGSDNRRYRMLTLDEIDAIPHMNDHLTGLKYSLDCIRYKIDETITKLGEDFMNIDIETKSEDVYIIRNLKRIDENCNKYADLLRKVSTDKAMRENRSEQKKFKTEILNMNDEFEALKVMLNAPQLLDCS